VALADGLANPLFKRVAECEVLHRLIQPKYVKPDNGGWRILAQGFADPERRISVNRAWLHGGDPACTQVEDTDYVGRVVAEVVFGLTVTLNARDGSVIERYGVSVDPVPLPDNDAHAEIYVDTQPTSKAPFRKLKEKLAELAEFEEGFGPPPSQS
jgi:hypothetical protein